MEPNSEDGGVAFLVQAIVSWRSRSPFASTTSVRFTSPLAFA